MNSKLRNVCLLLLSTLLAACGQLWGAEATPTTTPVVFWTIDPSTPLPFSTFTPVIVSPTPSPTETPVGPISPFETQTFQNPPLTYYAQAGDTLKMVADHFGVTPEEIVGPADKAINSLLVPETPLLIPKVLDETKFTPNRHIIPDSEIVYSPSAINFDTVAYVAQKNGYLNTYQQYLSTTGWTSGGEAVQRISIENSVNPRLLLALIDYESGWVSGQPSNLAQEDYPLGYIDFHYRLLYLQMQWVVQELFTGYYGWRSGSLTEITLTDGTTWRIAPDQNAGSVALQYFFAGRDGYEEWLRDLDPVSGFPAFYERMFGDPFARDQTVDPLIPPSLTQPYLTLPFQVNTLWSYTGGPHSAWGFNRGEAQLNKGALAALDFAPAAGDPGCSVSDAWVIASASGQVVRSENGVVILDLDNDGYEQTGWDLLYLHIATDGRVPKGTWLQAGGIIGHPSCEPDPDNSTGRHVHFARKFNGEWMIADGAVPFVLSGWTAHSNGEAYQGTLTRDGQTITSNRYGIFSSRITRNAGD